MTWKYNANKQSKNWDLTTNFKEDQDNPMDHFPDFSNIPHLYRVDVSLERGKKSNLLHWQSFVQCSQRIRACQLRRAVPGTTFQPHDSNYFAGISYVNKEPIVGPFTWFNGNWNTEPNFPKENIDRLINALTHVYAWNHRHNEEGHWCHELWQVLNPLLQQKGLKLRHWL